MYKMIVKIISLIMLIWNSIIAILMVRVLKQSNECLSIFLSFLKIVKIEFEMTF